MLLLWKITKVLVISLQAFIAITLPSVIIQLVIEEGFGNAGVFGVCLLGILFCSWFLFCIWAGLRINKNLCEKVFYLFFKDIQDKKF